MESNATAVLALVRTLSTGTAFFALVFVVVIWILGLVARRVFRALAESFPTYRLTLLQLQTVFSFAIYLGGGSLLIFGLLRPSPELVLALTGSAAVMVGFAFKDLATSMLAGLTILFDRPFQVGDRVAFQGEYGDIVSIGLRAVRLCTLGDSIVTIPNSKFLSEVVSSGNYGCLDMMVDVDLHVDPSADAALARDLVYEVAVTSRYAYLKKPVKVVVEEVAIAERLALRMRAKLYVLDTKFEKAMVTDITVRANQAFQERGIPRPKGH